MIQARWVIGQHWTYDSFGVRDECYIWVETKTKPSISNLKVLNYTFLINFTKSGFIRKANNWFMPNKLYCEWSWYFIMCICLEIDDVYTCEFP
jgi:hypothetical protein